MREKSKNIIQDQKRGTIEKVNGKGYLSFPRQFGITQTFKNDIYTLMKSN